MESRAYARKFLRICPGSPLFGTVSIVRIGSRRVYSNGARVRIPDISPGGLRFVSALKLPAGGPVILEVALTLGDVEYRLQGYIVRMAASEANEYEYGLKYLQPDLKLRETLKKTYGKISVRRDGHIIILKLFTGKEIQ